MDFKAIIFEPGSFKNRKNRKKENGEKKVGKWKGYENGKKERNRVVRKWNWKCDNGKKGMKQEEGQKDERNGVKQKDEEEMEGEWVERWSQWK